MTATSAAAPGQVEWVALSYLLTLVALVAPIGWLADSVGRTLLYTCVFRGIAGLRAGQEPDRP